MSKSQKKFKFSLKMPYGFNKVIHTVVILLGLFGVVMVISATMTRSSTSASLMVTLVKQLVFFVVGYVAMVLVARYFRLEWFKKHIFIIIGSMTVLLLVPLLFSSTGGANAWIPLGFGPVSTSIQPSEFAKIVIILVFAVYIGDVRSLKKTAVQILGFPMIILGIFVIIIVILQGDLGSALVMLGIAFFCFLVPAHPSLQKIKRIILVLLAIGLVIGICLMSPTGIAFLKTLSFLPDHYVTRLEIVTNPFADRYDTGFQIIAAWMAFYRGGWTGVGFAQSLMKYRNLSASESDMILSIIVEELGFIFGFLPILIGYSILFYQMFKNAFKVSTEANKIIMLGIIGYLFFHFFLNVGGVTGLIPLTGVPLLFISAGGTSLVSVYIMIGLAQNIISRENVKRRKQVIE